MAKLYEKLKCSLTSYEHRPKSTITKQTFWESLCTIRVKDKGRPAWRYILVHVSKLADLKAQPKGTHINVTEYGRIIKFRDNQGEIKAASGWGEDPPKIIETWIKEHYYTASIDENTNFTYKKDDIRLCTMQRAIPQQLIGVSFDYHRQERFNYITLIEGLQSSLAYRAGLRLFDRIIAINGVNIEQDTPTQCLKHIDAQRHLPLQLFVCSPATYAHYKLNNMSLHENLPTVQHLTPVYATSASNSNTDTPVVLFDEEIFYAIEWEHSDMVSTVPQSAVFKSPEFTYVNDVCCVKTKERVRYRTGKIIFKGSRDACEKLNTLPVLSFTGRMFHIVTSFFGGKLPNVLESTTNSIRGVTDSKSPSQDETTTTLFPENLTQIMETNAMLAQMTLQSNDDNSSVRQVYDDIQHIDECICTTLEDLPNELFFYLFTFVGINHLYSAFWGLNSRLNNIFQSSQNLSLTFDETVDALLMKSYARFTNRLIIDTPTNCDFSHFSNLHTLIMWNGNSNHLAQIQPKILPTLTHLSFSLGYEFIPPSQLVHDVFTNKFPSLRHVNLGHINENIDQSWSTSPSLRFVAISCDELEVIQAVLASCPNVHHFQLHVLSNNRFGIPSSALLNHRLPRFTIWSHSLDLSFTDIDVLLSYTPNVEHLYLQTVWCMPFVNLANLIITRLHNLSRFDGYVEERLIKDSRTGDLSTMHKIHPCFTRIECKGENDKYRILATK